MRRPRSEVPLQQQRRLLVRVRCEKADGHEPRRAAAVADDAPSGSDPLLPNEKLETCALRHGQLALRLRSEGVRRDQPRALRPFGGGDGGGPSTAAGAELRACSRFRIASAAARFPVS